jgi:hypothetical protein
LLIFAGSLAFAAAQSISPSYQAVDFINPEASTSSSAGYILNDSIDYYGGVNGSTNYVECTGDFAVLGSCGDVVAPPPPPPPPPPPSGGGGSGGSGGSGTVHWPDIPVTEPGTEPVIEPETKPEIPVKKPWKLPDIQEPVQTVEVPAQPVIRERTPVAQVVEPAKQQQLQVKAIREVQGTIKKVGSDVLRSVAPELCEDLTCGEVSFFGRPAAKVSKPVSAAGLCQIYTFGGFLIRMNCQDIALVWLAIAIMLIAPFPVGLLAWKKFWIKIRK